jgi:serine/threonine protein kinase
MAFTALPSCPSCGHELGAPDPDASLLRCDRCDRSFFGEDSDDRARATLGVTAPGPAHQLVLPPSHAGVYQLFEVLGSGAFSVVVRAIRVADGVPAAIKFLGLEKDPESRTRFVQEATLTASLRHRNIVQVLEIAVFEDPPFLVYEYLEGGSLRRLLSRRGAVPLAEAIETISQCLEGLSACHAAGIVHRDIKPENLLLDAHGVVKICDLGIAKTDNRGRSITSTGFVLGSPRYMAPEQWSGDPVSPATDVYAAGVVLYELLTGKAMMGEGPVAGMLLRCMDGQHVPLGVARPELSLRLIKAVDHALQVDPKLRPASAQEFLAELRGCRATPVGELSASRDRARPDQTRPSSTRALPVVFGLALLMLVLSLGWGHRPAVPVDPPFSDARFYQLLEKRQFAEALRSLGPAPQRPRELYRWTLARAIAHGQLLQRELADVELEQARQLEPENPEPEFYFGLWHWYSTTWRRHAMARRLRLAKLHPANQQLRLLVARDLQRSAKPVEAAAWLPRVCPPELHCRVVAGLWGASLEFLGRIAEAERFYADGRKQDPDWPAWEAWQAHCALAKYRVDLQDKYLDRICTIASRDPQTLGILLERTYDLSDGEKLQRVLTQLEAILPDSSAEQKGLVQLQLAIVIRRNQYAKSGNATTGEAFVALERAYQWPFARSRARVLWTWEFVYRETFRTEAAARSLATFLARLPVAEAEAGVVGSTGPLRLALARALLLSGHRSDAYALIVGLGLRREVEPELTGPLVELLAATGHRELARKRCQAFIRKDPDLLEIQMDLIAGVRASADDTEVVALCRRLAEEKPVIPYVYKELSRVAWSRGDLVKAAAYEAEFNRLQRARLWPRSPKGS